jgi:hypothetical protein
VKRGSVRGDGAVHGRLMGLESRAAARFEREAHGESDCETYSSQADMIGVNIAV